MKALVYYGPRDMKVVDYKEPEIGAGEVFLKVKAVGICGSDVHGYLGLTGRRIPPMIMGHEVVAEVVRTSRENSGVKQGQAVFVDPITVCGVCRNCQEGNTSICLNKKNIGVLEENGAFCEYIVMREENLIAMPENVEAKIGVLAEPFSVALHAINQINQEKEVGRAAVIGAGVIGICTAAVLMERYPHIKIVIMDLEDQRLKRCKEILGDNITCVNLGVCSYQETAETYAQGGFDLVMEAVGVEPTVNGALEIVKSKGCVILIGNNQKSIQLKYQQIITKELQVLGSYGFTHQDLETSISKFKERTYAKKMVDTVVSLEETTSYFDKLAGKGNDFLKVIVDPTL